MDDRDKDLTELFVRDLDDIPLPTRGAWRRVSRKETHHLRASGMLFTAGAMVAVLAAALVVGLQLNQRQQGVAAPVTSPTSIQATSGPSGKPAGTTCPQPNTSCAATGSTEPTATAIYNDDFGFVVTDLSTVPTIQPAVSAIIRTESNGGAVASFQHQFFAVSPDGRQIAYWSAQTPADRSQLRVAKAADPQSLLASSSLSANESGGRIIWANDSSAVAYTIVSPGPSIGAGAQGTTTTIRTFNVRPGSSGPGETVVQWNEAGKSIIPIAWDRAANNLAVGVTGRAGFLTDYIVVNTASPQSNPTRIPVTGRIAIASLAASTDARYVVGTDADAGFGYWPLENIGARIFPLNSKSGQTGAAWRPGTHEIGFIGPSSQFWLCDIDRNSPLGCGTTAFSGVPAGAVLRTFRADGSAVLLAVPGTGGAPTSYTLVRLSGDASAAKATGGDRVTFTDMSGLAASVRFR